MLPVLLVLLFKFASCSLLYLCSYSNALFILLRLHSRTTVHTATHLHLNSTSARLHLAVRLEGEIFHFQLNAQFKMNRNSFKIFVISKKSFFLCISHFNLFLTIHSPAIHPKYPIPISVYIISFEIVHMNYLRFPSILFTSELQSSIIIFMNPFHHS